MDGGAIRSFIVGTPVVRAACSTGFSSRPRTATGVISRILSTEELVELVYSCYNRDDYSYAEAISNKEAELKKLKYHLSDTQFNQILESQKKDISILWAQCL